MTWKWRNLYNSSVAYYKRQHRTNAMFFTCLKREADSSALMYMRAELNLGGKKRKSYIKRMIRRVEQLIVNTLKQLIKYYYCCFISNKAINVHINKAKACVYVTIPASGAPLWPPDNLSHCKAWQELIDTQITSLYNIKLFETSTTTVLIFLYLEFSWKIRWKLYETRPDNFFRNGKDKKIKRQ